MKYVKTKRPIDLKAASLKEGILGFTLPHVSPNIVGEGINEPILGKDKPFYRNEFEKPVYESEEGEKEVENPTWKRIKRYLYGFYTAFLEMMS